MSISSTKSSGGTGTWGGITGTLSDQTDLQAALDAKAAKAANLSDLTNAATARTNLGLGTAATQNTTAFDAAGDAAAAQAFSIQRSNHTGTQLASTISDFAAAAGAAVLPTGGSTGQALVKSSGTDFDVAWGTVVPTGTASRFAGFDGAGSLESINNWQRNSLFGASVNQAPSFTDTGSPLSQVLNQNTTVISATNNLTNTYILQNLTQVSLGSTFDYAAFTGHEFSASQTDASDIADLVLLFPRVTLGAGGGTNTSNNVRVIDSQVRLSGGHVANIVKGISSSVQMDGATAASEITGLVGSTYCGGTVDYAYGVASIAQIAGGATLNQTLYGAQIGSQVDGGGTANNATIQRLYHSGNLTADLTGQSVNASGTIGGSIVLVNMNNSADSALETTGQVINLNGVCTGDLVGSRIDTSSTVGGNYLGSFWNQNSAVTGYANIISTSITNSIGGSLNQLSIFGNGSATVGGDFRVLNAGMDGAVTGFGAGTIITQNGVVTKGYTGYGSYVNDDIGDGSGVNAIGFDASFQGGVIAGGLFGFNYNNASSITGTVNSYGLNVNNQSTATGYGMFGVSIYNQGDQTEQFIGVNVANDADSRTATGINVNMQGAITDDVQGMRISMNGSVSSANNVNGIQIQMGNASGNEPQGVTGFQSDGRIEVNAATQLKSSLGFQIGSRLEHLYTIPSGSPVTGTDELALSFAGDLMAEDDVSNGGFGIGFNGAGMISSFAIANTKTVQSATVQLVAATFPDPGSFTTGGAITDLNIIRMFAPLPQGGTVVLTNLYGLKIDPGFGTFGSTATNPWGVWVGDDTCNNYFAKNVVIGGVTGLPTVSDTLDVTGSMVVSGNIGFFGTASQPQQASSGAATAGLVYTVTEQTMLQEVYNAVRAYGLMT